MAQNWQELTKLTGGQSLTVEKVRLEDGRIAIEGSFELPPLARLTWEDQVFVAAFVKAHGSIKEMERLFGVSYPTIKGRLNKISEAMEFMRIDFNIGFDSEPEEEKFEPAPDPLELLEKGEIDVKAALEMIKGRKNKM